MPKRIFISEVCWLLWGDELRPKSITPKLYDWTRNWPKHTWVWASNLVGKARI